MVRVKVKGSGGRGMIGRLKGGKGKVDGEIGGKILRLSKF